ncbi:MAG TPA: FAD binding domain-containing protein [Hyphomicrobiaceae bacterium]|nr:FAD binding domain-containing protein [Hyphomicrobiaceae bacterium]
MKSAAFDYTRPASVAEALQSLAANPNAKVLAGGQTLGPMLNLRFAQPALLVDITRIPELAAVSEDAESISIGATVTHAAIEDGRVPDPTAGFLGRVARGIAHRAVRTRGTIGGSLAHADPAADWLACLTALDAEIAIAGERGTRLVALTRFARGAMETDLGADELLAAIRIPRVPRGTRFGFHKICRKAGEFAEAIGVAVCAPGGRIIRLVASTANCLPVVCGKANLGSGAGVGAEEIQRWLADAGLTGDSYELKLAAVAAHRAVAEAMAP